MDNINKQDYQKYVDEKIPKPTLFKNCVRAFVVGGLICMLGQFITNSLENHGLPLKQAVTATSMILIFLGAFLTGLGVYDKLGKFAGAGSIVPITGFANSIVASAMEYKSEGFIFGVAAKMFLISGPVLVYGYGSSIIVGFIYLLVKK